MSRKSKLISLLALALGFAGAGALWIRSLIWTPAPVMDVDVTCAPDTEIFPVDRPIRIVTWNIQYSAGRAHHFFYDGGSDVRVTEGDVHETLGQITQILREIDADIVLLQEVDRASDRTARIDELAGILDALPYPCHTSTPYHKAGYVPYPSHAFLGKVDMHLAILSRFRITSATRHQLAMLQEPWWRRAFNLKRAVLEVELPTQNGRTLTIFNTHLSAFSRGDGTLKKQMDQLDALMTRVESEGGTWMLAGDLNALAPGDDPARLGNDAALYAESSTPVGRLFQRFTSLIPASQFESNPTRWYTYLPFGAKSPDRTLDYVFYGRGMKATGSAVLSETGPSDHLPMLAVLTLADP